MSLKCFLPLSLWLLSAIISTSHAQPSAAFGTVDIDYVQKISGKTHLLSIDFKLKKGWKIYWHSGGASALPPRIIWDTPSQALIEHSQILWAYPEKLSVLQIESLGYTGEFSLPVQVTTRQLNADNLTLFGTLHYPVCADICIPAQEKFSINLAKPLTQSTALNPKLARILEAVPVNLELIDDSQLYWVDTEQGILLHGDLLPHLPVLKKHKLRDLKKIILSYRPADSYHGIYLLPKLKQQQDDAWQLSARKNQSDNQFYLPNNFAVQVGQNLPLLLTAQYQGEFIETRLLAKYQQLPPDNRVNNRVDNRPGAPPSSMSLYAFILLALLALLAGLLLNLMPCVLPVLSLKLLPIAKLNSHAENYQAEIASFRHNALLSAMGIMIGFQLLALLLWSLSLSGFVGWGAQFQSPTFLLMMVWALLLFVAIEKGWQQFSVPFARFLQQSKPNRKMPLILQKLSTGIIIAWLASSCTAPIIGTIVGAAIGGGTLQLFIMLALLSLGMASPYLLIASVPNSVKLLPKTGRWNLWLKEIITLSLLLTALWLLYLLSFHLNSLQMIALMLVIMLLLGASYAKYRGSAIMQKLPLFIIALILLLGITLYPQSQQYPPNLTDVSIPQAHIFEPAKISALLQTHQAVIVDITARWCITCKVNDKRVWLSERGQTLLADPTIYLMRADWTLPNKQIETFLQQYQRYAIPFTIIYRQDVGQAGEQDGGQGVILPEFYRLQDVQQAISAK